MSHWDEFDLDRFLEQGDLERKRQRENADPHTSPVGDSETPVPPRVPSGGGEGQHEQELGDRLLPVAVEAGEGTLSLGAIEIRPYFGDPDDVVAPWEQQGDILVHAERMDEGAVWMHISDRLSGASATFWFRAKKKGELDWTLTDSSPASTTPPEVAPSPDLYAAVRWYENECEDFGANSNQARIAREAMFAGRLASATTKAGQAESDLGDEQSSSSAGDA